MEKGRKDKTKSAHPNLHLSGHESIHKRDTRPLMSQPENRSGADRFPYSKPEIDLDRDEYQRLMQAMHIFTKEVRQFETALYEVVRFASHEFQANCQIRLFNEQEKALTLAAIHDQNSHIFQQMHVSLEDFSISIPKGDRETTWLEKNIPFHIQDKTQKKANREVLQILWPFEDHVPLSDLLVVPLTFEETLIGILILTRYASGSDSFSKKDMNYANNFASVAADAIKLALDYDQLQHQVSDQQDQFSVLRNSAQLFRQVFESSSEAIFICDKDGIITYVNDAALQKYGYHREELLDQEISIISLDDLSMNFITEESDLSEHGGAFECLTRQKDGTSIYTEVIIQPFLQEGKKLIQINTRDISDRVLTQNKLETQINRLHAIRAIDLVMKNSAELQSILEFILNQIKLELEVDAVILLQLNEDGNRLTCISAQGFKDKLENKYAPDMENSYAGRIVTNHKIISKNNMDKQEVSNFPDFLTNEQLTSYCGVPLLINEKVKGVIETFSREKFDLNYDWINYLETLAGHAAIAIENYQLFNGLRQSNLDVVKAYDATIAGWSRALDLRDNETEGHTERVTDMTTLLAKEAGYSEEEIVHIRRGAMLHDIGKIGIPDSILLKPGKLDEAEWKIMKKHPQYAYDMLCDIEYLRPALDIPLCHHEKWDGTGYPRGLEGDKIPFSARLFTIVDVWDALRSDRPYREKWVDERVYLYIKEKNGSHFDPQAVELFLKVVKKDSLLNAKDYRYKNKNKTY